MLCQQAEQSWTIINQDDLDSQKWTKAYQEIIAPLRYLLSDDGVGLHLQGLPSSSGLILRVSILPRDASDSQWDIVPARSGERRRKLARLSQWLETGWDGNGPRLKSVVRSEMGESELTSQTSDSALNLDALYANVDSPPDPQIPSDADGAKREILD